MSYGYWESDRRYRRRFLVGLVRFVVVGGLLLAAGATGYQVGVQDDLADDNSAKEEVARLKVELQGAVDAKVAAEGAALRARADAQRWEARWRAEVPDGPARDLLAQIQARLKDGTEADRLALAIEAAGPPRDCATPEVKRFFVKTPITPDAANMTAGFAGGTVVVTANGASERTTDGRPEAWYDPAQPVTARFTLPGGRPIEATGVLPLYASVLTTEHEVRFAVIPANRGFVQATAERCKRP